MTDALENPINGDCENFSWRPLPPEFWELQELVQNGCPDEALKTFRKSVIGKKNPLTAREANAAIAGALTTCRTGKIIDTRKKERAYELPSVELFIDRANWYARTGIPVCFARPYDYEWTEPELEFIHEHKEHALISEWPSVAYVHAFSRTPQPEPEEHKCVLSFLSFDDDAVDRVEGP